MRSSCARNGLVDERMRRLTFFMRKYRAGTMNDTKNHPRIENGLFVGIFCFRTVNNRWYGRRESNSRHELGRLLRYHYATPACAVLYETQTLCVKHAQ